MLFYNFVYVWLCYVLLPWKHRSRKINQIRRVLSAIRKCALILKSYIHIKIFVNTKVLNQKTAEHTIIKHLVNKLH